ncbi:MAG: DUF3048 domain-containing protein [Acidimicrobiia bacterium]
MRSLLDSTAKKVVLAIAVLAVLVGAGAAVAVSSGSGDSATGTTTTTTSSTTTTEAPTTTTTVPPPPPVFPLTGEPAPDVPAAAQPAVVVKIDNLEPSARPQVGVNQADVVFEEQVEGGITRFLAVFQSTDQAPVGPVRSARSSDVGIVSMLNRPLMAWSGANDIFAAQIRASNIVDVGYDVAGDLYYRERSRRSPHNLFLSSIGEAWARPHDGSGPPPALFRFRAPGEAPAGLEPVSHVRVTFSQMRGNAPVDYVWDGAGWARTQAGRPHVDADGVQVAPANVVVQFVEYVGADANDKAGHPLPEAALVGEGEAWVLTAGGMVRGRWVKPTPEDVTQYLDAAGQPIALSPGRTWVALPPPGGAAVLG